MKKEEVKQKENIYYHNTQKLLDSYRDVIWSLEVATHQIKEDFKSEFGESIDDFLDTVYVAGADLTGTKIESQSKSIARSRKMLKILENSVDILRCKHKNGEEFYWILYYTYLIPQKITTVDDVVEKIALHVSQYSRRNYYRKRKEAIKALSSILWGYSTQECLNVLDKFVPANV